MPKTTIVNEAWREKVDGGTGELMELEHSVGTRTIHSSEPPFVKLYITDVLYMQDMPKGLTNVVYALLDQATYAKKGLRISISTGFKNEICEQLGIPRQTLNNALVKLCKGKILRRIDTGLYELNPYFFGRGEWKDIDNLRMTWDYNDIKGKTFHGAITRKDGTVEPTGDAAQEAEEDYHGSAVPEDVPPEEEEEPDGEECPDTRRIAV